MKVAVVGCGSMGRRRIRHVLGLQLGDAFAYDIRADRRKEVQEEYGIRTVNSVEELVREEPGAIFISVPPAEHMFYLKLAAEHGWHFMVENPIYCKLEGIEELVRTVEAKRLITHVSSNKRFHQGVVLLRKLIGEQAIGPVLGGIVEIGEWLPDWHPYEPYTDYYPSRRSMGGGLDAICDVEWIVDLFGPVERMACLAGKKSTLDVDTDDIVQFLLDFRSGTQVAMHTDMIQRVYAHTVRFFGEKGTLDWDLPQHCVRLYRAETKAWEVHPEGFDPAQWPTMKLKEGFQWVEPMYYEDTLCFVGRLRKGDTSTASLMTGIANLRLILEALECSRQNRVWVAGGKRAGTPRAPKRAPRLRGREKP